ncbi:DUF397 domain-containing protein [Streptomyces sp. NPDC058653]|uniref:DUF397 domain-containing protein n=1 Tax=Streptomyces sp. NPDC058653 TaxID=3346576 RepID=UPI003654B5BF
MPSPAPSTTRWRKSSYSNGDGGECVEVADDQLGVILVRDSKNPTGPVLVLHPAAWAGFLRGGTY